MKHTHTKHAAACVLALGSVMVGAQVSPPAPLVTPPISLPYESVFKGYQTHQDVPLRDWKASNEAVRKAGGWREYLKESQTPDVQNTSDKSPPSEIRSIDHSQHSKPAEGKKP